VKKSDIGSRRLIIDTYSAGSQRKLEIAGGLRSALVSQSIQFDNLEEIRDSSV
jgi:hypothetical protein